MVKVFCFDQFNKYELLKSYLKGCKTIQLYYSYDVEEAAQKIKKIKPDILLYGGDFNSEEWKAPQLWHRVIEEVLDYRNIYTIITTWNSDEARAMKAVSPKSFYLPFCESLANVVKTRARIINTRKRKNAT